jgi:hypothetical protein
MDAQYLWKPFADKPWGRIEDMPENPPAEGVYRLKYFGPDPDTGIEVFEIVGIEDPAWATRPGVRYLTGTELRQIRALRSQRDGRGKRRYTLAEIAAQFGTTATTVGRITRPKDHVPVPRRRRKDQETRS